ncbi:MAG: hypothetical protein AAFY29_20020 [Pseudomonadota bacterium]
MPSNATPPRVAVFVTGQLRNASEHIENWLSTGFANCTPLFFFTVWDEIGHVDLSRMYQRSLRQARRGETYVEISSVGIYLSRYSELEHEIQLIEQRLGGNCSFRVVPYQKSFLRRIDDLEMPDQLAEDTHPFWQSCVPMAYMNKRAIEEFQESQAVDSFDAFCRIQGETTFNSAEEIDWVGLSSNSDQVITSPDTVNPAHQLSVKFFAAGFKPFLTLMTAYYPSIDAWRAYVPGSPWEEQPIGERFLKRLCDEHGYSVDFSVSTSIRRQRMFPVHPVLLPLDTVRAEWTIPEVVDVGEQAVSEIRKWEENNPLVLGDESAGSLSKWLPLPGRLTDSKR